MNEVKINISQGYNANLLKVRFIVNFNLGDIERIVLASIVINIIESCFE